MSPISSKTATSGWSSGSAAMTASLVHMRSGYSVCEWIASSISNYIASGEPWGVRRQHLSHPLAGQFVGPFVVLVAGVALDPVPGHLVAQSGLVQPAPQVLVLHRLLVG